MVVIDLDNIDRIDRLVLVLDSLGLFRRRVRERERERLQIVPEMI